MEVALSKGQIGTIDDSDYPIIAPFKWYALNLGCRWYACATTWEGKKNKHISMHRLLMGFPKGKDIDHINHNGLDNRRINLRVCTRSENHFNRRKYPSISKYKGVSQVKYSGKWRARLKIHGKEIHLGCFNAQEEAAQAYDAAAAHYFGEYAFTNMKIMRASA